MIREALEFLIGTRSPTNIKLENGLEAIDRLRYEVLEEPITETIILKSLDSLCDLINNKTEDSYLQVLDSNKVICRTDAKGPSLKSHVIYTAISEFRDPSVNVGQFSQEGMLIYLAQNFILDQELTRIMNLVKSVQFVSEDRSDDDGISQNVQKKSGVVKKESGSTVKNQFKVI